MVYEKKKVINATARLSDGLEDEECSFCDRPKRYVCCEDCCHGMKDLRAKKICPAHPKVFNPMDLRKCIKCGSLNLKEMDEIPASPSQSGSSETSFLGRSTPSLVKEDSDVVDHAPIIRHLKAILNDILPTTPVSGTFTTKLNPNAPIFSAQTPKQSSSPSSSFAVSKKEEAKVSSTPITPRRVSRLILTPGAVAEKVQPKWKDEFKMVVCTETGNNLNLCDGLVYTSSLVGQIGEGKSSLKAKTNGTDKRLSRFELDFPSVKLTTGGGPSLALESRLTKSNVFADAHASSPPVVSTPISKTVEIESCARLATSSFDLANFDLKSAPQSSLGGTSLIPENTSRSPSFSSSVPPINRDKQVLESLLLKYSPPPTSAKEHLVPCICMRKVRYILCSNCGYYEGTKGERKYVRCDFHPLQNVGIKFCPECGGKAEDCIDEGLEE